MRSMLKRVVTGLFVAAIWLLIWALAAKAVGSSFILPSPVDTFFALIRLAGTGSFALSITASLLRVLAGFLCAVALGTFLGALCAMFRPCDALLTPLRSIIRATPVVSFILLVILWTKANFVPGFISFLMVLPVVWMNIQEGLRAVDQNLLEMAKVFRMGFLKTVRLIYLPSLLPHLLAACATGLGLAWKSGVAAEILAYAKPSIGNGMWQSKVNLETADTFAWTVAVILVSMLLELLVVGGLKRLSGRVDRGRGAGK